MSGLLTYPAPNGAGYVASKHHRDDTNREQSDASEPRSSFPVLRKRAYFLGRQAALEFQYADFFDGIDIIIPVPLHLKRLRERGYNQSEYIARGISDVTGIPIDTTHVVRSRNTPKQALQKGDERKQNVSEAFTVNHPEQMYHKHILLVDDLITTGETAKACLHAMKKFRGASFSVFSLCKAS